MDPDLLLRTLADQTRLRIVHLLHARGELCVCDLVTALALPQPKVSRHLAVMRQSQTLLGRREGQWIHYRISPDLPAWAMRTIDALMDGCATREPYRGDLQRLAGGTQGSCAVR